MPSSLKSEELISKPEQPLSGGTCTASKLHKQRSVRKSAHFGNRRRYCIICKIFSIKRNGNAGPMARKRTQQRDTDVQCFLRFTLRIRSILNSRNAVPSFRNIFWRVVMLILHFDSRSAKNANLPFSRICEVQWRIPVYSTEVSCCIK
jgi:hypothetical protein